MSDDPSAGRKILGQPCCAWIPAEGNCVFASHYLCAAWEVGQQNLKIFKRVCGEEAMDDVMLLKSLLEYIMMERGR